MSLLKISENLIETSFQLNFLSQNTILTQIIYYLTLFLISVLSYLHFSVKIFRILCYTKMTFEWFPMINPYKWPFSVVLMITRPYFRIWETFFPMIKLKDSSVDVSAIIGLEVLNSILYICFRIVQYLLEIVQQIEKFIT